MITIILRIILYLVNFGIKRLFHSHPILNMKLSKSISGLEITKNTMPDFMSDKTKCLSVMSENTKWPKYETEGGDIHRLVDIENMPRI